MLMSSFLEITTKCSRLTDNKITVIIPNDGNNFNLLNNKTNCNIQLKVIQSNNNKYRNDLLVHSCESSINYSTLSNFLDDIQKANHIRNITNPLIFLFYHKEYFLNSWDDRYL